MMLPKEMPMKFVLHPGFTEEQIKEKILSDEAILMEEPVYQFIMFAVLHNFTEAIKEVQEGIEFDVYYIYECDLAAVAEDGSVVVLFKPPEREEDEEDFVSLELTEKLKGAVLPGFVKSTDKEEDTSEETQPEKEEESSDDDWDGWL